MVKETALKLYAHYMAIGRKEAADEMRAHIKKKYGIDPDVKEEEPKETKSKGKK